MKQKVNLFFMASTLVVLSSCSSWIESSRKMIDEEEAKNQQQARSTTQPKWVSQDQYNDLLVKYKDLSEKYEKLKDEKLTSKNNFDQIDELAQSNPSVSTETVDVFGKNGIAKEVEMTLGAQESDSDLISRELKTYKKAVALKENGKADESLKIFQFLERSSNKQIKVRARAQVGEIYLGKKQFDLALQVFEKMITENAFSGKVLFALEGAVQSCDGLGLADKKLRYQSMLRDFFGIKG